MINFIVVFNRRKHFFARHKIISGILILVVLGVIGGMLGGDKEVLSRKK